MDDLRIGVIGAGGRGGLARLAHKPGEGSRLVAGVDNNEKTLEKFKRDLGDDVFTTRDYRELLAREDIDAVFVTTPDFLHEEHAVAALEVGKAVYLEKPMAITIEGCDRILETARETGSRLYLGHNMRHLPAILKMKEVIDSGIIGPVQAAWCRHFVAYGGDAFFKDWHSERKYSTGMLLQKAAHDIDVMHWLAGGYTKAVVGMGRLSVYDKCERRSPDEPGDKTWVKTNWPPLTQKKLSPIIDIEDHSMIMMQLDNGVQGSYVQCHYTPDACRNYTFIGTQGRVENMGNFGGRKIVVYTKRDHAEGPDIVHDIEKIEGSHGGADPRIVEEFLRFVREGTPTSTSPVAARYAVATGVMATESIRTDNGLRAIPELDGDLVDYFEGGQTGGGHTQ